jgi:hypothetical protein
VLALEVSALGYQLVDSVHDFGVFHGSVVPTYGAKPGMGERQCGAKQETL